jgi:uncharacterized protein Yka (UPF0111/DUF47 family)
MPTKALIIDDLGERALLLPQQLEDALSANDRVKFYFTLLQAAELHADRPDEPLPDLSAERRAAGVADGQFDRAAAECRRESDGSLRIVGAADLRRTILDCVAAMRVPLSLAGLQEASAMSEREASLAARLPQFAADRIPAGTIHSITQADRARGDSLHILVMDMHKALNGLQSELAVENIEGAQSWRIEDTDRPLVRAFMSGVNRTAPLKFDHPGLGTTVMRAGGRLVIQNDIGTTDAHVLVVHIQGLSATLTYTDVHAQRAAFFQSLFKPFAVRWDDTRARHGERHAAVADYYLCVGRFEAESGEALERYLAFLGSRIVFLIDWNRARKRLREFLRKGDTIRLLKWAADNDVGHRGFLKLGGERLLYEAVEFAQQTPLHYGERLHEALGPEAAFDYLKFVLRAAAEGLLQGRSERFVRDEVKAELARRFRSAQEGLLSIASEHAALVFELAGAVRDGLLRYGEEDGAAFLERTARRAQKWEKDADALVSRTRSLVRRAHKPDAYFWLLHEADDAADGLEEAAFLMTLVPKLQPAQALLEPIRGLASLLVDGAQELVKMLESASHVHREGQREDVQDFLEAVERLVAIEHETDEADRGATALLVLEAPDFRILHLLSNLAHGLEEAADALARSALRLRDHLLHDVMAG